ncbi:metallophosphoesterase [Luteolibacter marinus]|uniref:metallophosphoesterase n=1 Tax=Luteolibacter marinus TaxID=2776705 RepID=UPI001867B0A1|nr:metallophosphoesterase [Luteolibacter marinus]
MKLPVRILSDLHLGHRVSRISDVESLRPLVSGVGTVIFNGDTWQELARPFRERSAAMLEELKAICAAEGTEVVFLSGNHDPGWPGPGWAELAAGRILVTHGDALFSDGSPWSREALLRQERVAKLWQRHQEAADDPAERIVLARKMALLLRAAEYPKGKRLWQRALDAINPPRRAFEMLRVWTTQADAAAAFAGQYFPQAEVVIKGHFHRPGIWHKRGRLIINLGAFMNPCPALWADYDGHFLRCGRVDERGPACRTGEVTGVWRLMAKD